MVVEYVRTVTRPADTSAGVVVVDEVRGGRGHQHVVAVVAMVVMVAAVLLLLRMVVVVVVQQRGLGLVVQVVVLRVVVAATDHTAVVDVVAVREPKRSDTTDTKKTLAQSDVDVSLPPFLVIGHAYGVWWAHVRETGCLPHGVSIRHDRCRHARRSHVLCM